MTTAVATRKPLTRIRLIGFIAMGVCAIGYAGFALALLAGKLDYLPMTQAAIIAAVYALLTIALAPISSGLIQCRVSEAMSVLPYFTFAAVPGLFIGCVIANLLVAFLISMATR